MKKLLRENIDIIVAAVVYALIAFLFSAMFVTWRKELKHFKHNVLPLAKDRIVEAISIKDVPLWVKKHQDGQCFPNVDTRVAVCMDQMK